MGMSDTRAPAAHTCPLGSRAPIRETPAVPVSEKRRGSRDAMEAPAVGQSAARRTLALPRHALDVP